MKIVILGSTGMLGHALVKYLQTFHHEIIPISREFFDASKDSFNKIPSCNWIINCIGAIKQNSPSIDELKTINAEFPHKLASALPQTKLIHVSTDCVFSGKKGRYVESDIPDPVDDYGTSKLEGECTENSMVIRTSLIGREIRGKKSLLEWCLSQRGEEIHGYTNHIWNGLTTREFSKCIGKIIEGEMFSKGLYHVFSTPVSKYELISSLNDKFKLGMNIVPWKTELSVDRTLSTEKNLNSKLEVSNFEQMLRELE